MKNGKRWSTARAFLDPARSRPNLTIETDALCDKVLLEGKRAVGVAYSVHGQKREARAGREVIVAVRLGACRPACSSIPASASPSC